MKGCFRALAGAAAMAFYGTAALAASSGEITGAGATFPYPVYAKWAEQYKAQTGIALNYQSIGSGGGIKQIEARTVDFGASDMPLQPADLDKNGLIQWPMVMGGAVPVVNIPGIGPGQLRLSGPVLAAIYLGKITRWNDPAVAGLNPELKLPSQAIAVIHRADGSGTTFLFTNYLSQVSPEWKAKVGSSTSVQWPVGLGGKGNEGVANFSRRTPGAIGYVEFAYALQNKLAYAQLQNRDGDFVNPDAASFGAAAANADWHNAKDFHLVLTNQPGKGSWPISGASFILFHRVQDSPNRTQQVLKFFDWAYHNGGQTAQQLDYVPMPQQVAALVEQAWKRDVKTADGKPVWPAQ